MRTILIVGAGQAGLQLGNSLLENGYDVTIVSAREPEEIRTGKVISTQVLFHPALDLERRHGLNLWEQDAPQIPGIVTTVVDPPGNPALRFQGSWDSPALSVDQRVKMPGWLELFEGRGGNVVYRNLTPADLEQLVHRHDLTLIAAGKGELGHLFERDAQRSPFDRRQRVLSCIYLHGVTPWSEYPEGLGGINLIPGVGELFSIPAYTTSGPCHIEFWEGLPNGPLDCWRDHPSVQQHLRRTLDLMREYVPWEYERCVDAEPTDALCSLTGGYPPVVRRPVGRLSDGACVLGMADVVVLNDPIAGQGANNAAHCAEIYLGSILERGDQPFDPDWMQRTFDAYWDYAQHPTNFSNALLGPPPEHFQRVLGAAADSEAVARRFANGFAEPPDFAEWLLDSAKCDDYLVSVASAVK